LLRARAFALGLPALFLGPRRLDDQRAVGAGQLVLAVERLGGDLSGLNSGVGNKRAAFVLARVGIFENAYELNGTVRAE
jgi:hypothetical protein